jgi:hypothetical protein
MQKFHTGQLLVTRGVHQRMGESTDFTLFVHHSLQRHQSGDWGDCYPEDKQSNDNALNGSDRLFSVYTTADQKIWIITEYDRSVTTVLFSRGLEQT